MHAMHMPTSTIVTGTGMRIEAPADTWAHMPSNA
jgi:hypothetical protein